MEKLGTNKLRKDIQYNVVVFFLVMLSSKIFYQLEIAISFSATLNIFQGSYNGKPRNIYIYKN